MELVIPALIGGAMIGTAASLLLWLNGRIAGISGIAFGLYPSKHLEYWRLVFLVCLPIGALLMQALVPIQLLPSYQTVSVGLMLVSGLLVGAGTRLGGGCTSGHGVCGLARLSKRSVVAVLIFMLCAFLTSHIVRHVIGASL